MMYERQISDGVLVLTPAKNLVGGEETTALVREVAALAASGPVRVVLDLQRVNWVSSLGIEALRRIHRICESGDGWLRIACVGSRIRSVLLTMRLHWVFETYDTMDEAIAAPAAPPKAPRAGSPGSGFGRLDVPHPAR